MSWRKYIGPGPLVAAAFIGPGTVTVCTLAGVNFGMELLWALGLSVVATIVLQEMAARIGLVTQKGLASVISQSLHKGIVRYFSIALVLMAIVLGNAAYEAGNISGGALGVSLFFPLPTLSIGQLEISLTNLLIGSIAMLLLLSGNFKTITGYLTVLVVLMSLAFLLTAILLKPNFHELADGFIPRINSENILNIVALIGTTVVPYNLFLHSTLVSKKWKEITDIKYIRFDTILAVVIGGLVSMSIVVTAASGKILAVESAADLAMGLETLLGSYAKYFMAFGLFSAGITSAITAPLAGAMVVCGCFGWSTEIQRRPMRISIIVILGLGLIFSSFGIKPIQLISWAQVSNGILLPLLSAYILWLVNKKSVMKGQQNKLFLNLIGIPIWLITLILGGWTVFRIFFDTGG
ncbi:NRAMP (natural resistance-associated macrophage protein) metal ion transporters [Belliella buryatensis]|uniref:NRAMP (Natural resistance-associated macrophage protein) metal ion transporters n=1 Tax=Belliella buryatensis TaxID=1500549 RepID=A0A239EMX3_9BACT|nr:Nramp family divalent metal transporter [Belliella buryatensis]SNS45272.1 NRAMP (natural resistance-associated macrophage protein) metal ion transporters [Belliella buryatensis]